MVLALSEGIPLRREHQTWVCGLRGKSTARTNHISPSIHACQSTWKGVQIGTFVCRCIPTRIVGLDIRSTTEADSVAESHIQPVSSYLGICYHRLQMQRRDIFQRPTDRPPKAVN